MTSVFSTAYFPPIAYCAKLKEFDNVTIDLGEHFVKQSHRNRTYVLGPNGVLKLIVPLKRWKNNTVVKDIKICYDENWRKLHWKSLEAAYRSSPYFEFYEDELKEIILTSQHQYLCDLNQACLVFVIDKLDLTINLKQVLTYQEINDENDFRFIPFASGDKSRTYKEYNQVFSDSSFVSNLSFLDLICNEGPNSTYKL